MLKRAEKLLYTLPTGLQNVALSLYGISLLRNRHGGNYKSYYEQAVARSRASRQELDKYESGHHFSIRDVDEFLDRAGSKLLAGWGKAKQALPDA